MRLVRTSPNCVRFRTKCADAQTLAAKAYRILPDTQVGNLPVAMQEQLSREALQWV